jgi:hypothetical protein
MFRLENAHKLATKEDPHHLHKILGVICMAHFAYRIALLMTTGNMQFHHPQDVYMITLHGALSVSSVVFHLSSVRNALKPMIYPEFRDHSILFACRSVAACCMHYSGCHYLWTMLLCLSTMNSADRITLCYQGPAAQGRRTTTMRNMPFDDGITPEDQLRIVRMHSRMQLGATWFMLISTDAAFLPLFAIQLAAFLMTLVRKSIITSRTWHLLYSIALWLNYEVLAQFTPGQLVMVTILYNLHHQVCFPRRANKYMVWVTHFVVYTAWTESGSSAYFTRQVYGVLGSFGSFGSFDTGVPNGAEVLWMRLVKMAVVGYYAGNVRAYWPLFVLPPVET